MKLRPAHASAGLGDARPAVMAPDDAGAAGGKDFAATSGRLLGRGGCPGDFAASPFTADVLACAVWIGTDVHTSVACAAVAAGVAAAVGETRAIGAGATWSVGAASVAT